MTDDTTSAADFRASPEGQALCQKVYLDCLDVIEKNATEMEKSVEINDTAQYALIMETGSHLIAAGAYMIYQRLDPSLKEKGMIHLILKRCFDSAESEMAQLIKAEKNKIIH